MKTVLWRIWFEITIPNALQLPNPVHHQYFSLGSIPISFHFEHIFGTTWHRKYDQTGARSNVAVLCLAHSWFARRLRASSGHCVNINYVQHGCRRRRTHTFCVGMSQAIAGWAPERTRAFSPNASSERLIYGRRPCLVREYAWLAPTIIVILQLYQILASP